MGLNVNTVQKRAAAKRDQPMDTDRSSRSRHHRFVVRAFHRSTEEPDSTSGVRGAGRNSRGMGTPPSNSEQSTRGVIVHIHIDPKKAKYSLVLPIWLLVLLTATIVTILLWKT